MNKDPKIKTGQGEWTRRWTKKEIEEFEPIANLILYATAFLMGCLITWILLAGE